MISKKLHHLVSKFATRPGLVFAVAGGTAPLVDANLERYRALSRSHIEESRAFDRTVDRMAERGGEAVRRRAIESDRILAKLLAQVDTRSRLEYILRDPTLWKDLTLATLEPIKDPGLLDELLWAYLQGQTDSFFKARDTSWPLLRVRIKDFVSRKRSLLIDSSSSAAVAHRSWWEWFVTNEIEDPFADSRLRGLDRFLALLTSRDRDRQAEHWIEARYVIGSHPASQSLAPALDSAVTSAFLAGLDRPGVSALIEVFGSVKPEYPYLAPKVALLGVLGALCDQKGWRDLGARAAEKAARLQADRSIDGEDPRRLLALADSFAAINRPDKAADYYQRATRKPAALEPWELVEAYRGAALALVSLSAESPSPRRDREQEWAAEYFRRALNGGLSTPYRDDLLEGYAKLLGRLGQWRPSFEVYESLFTGGSTRASRLTGLDRGLDALVDGLSRNYPLTQKRVVLKRYIELLAFYARTPFERDRLVTRLAQARDWSARLKTTGDARSAATLREIETRLGAR